MNIPHEWHDDAPGEALLPPLVGTEHDAAGRIILALQGLGLTVTGVAVTDDGAVHVVVQTVEATNELLGAIDREMCCNKDVAGRWWIDDVGSWTTLTQLGFEVGE